MSKSSKSAKAIWTEYDRLGREVSKLRRQMADASGAEKRDLIRRSHLLIMEMDELTSFAPGARSFK